VTEAVIVGAGLTGLSAAYHLEQSGFYDYQIVDAAASPGGLLRSPSHNGFTFDYTGHLLHISDPYFYQFLDTVMSIDALDKIQRKAAIFSHNVLTNYPFQINLYGLPTDVAAECIEGYVQRNRSNKKPATFHQWVLTYFGAGFGKHFFFPYNHKQLAYDLRKVHAAQTGRFAPSTSLSAIIKGTIDPNPANNIGYNASFYYPRQGGIESLIKNLVCCLRNKPLVNHCVTHIDTANKQVFFADGTQTRYKTLINTIPLKQLLTCLSPSARTPWAASAKRLRHNSVININLGFNTALPTPMHWIYFPEETVAFYRLGFWHNLSRASVPTGNSAIYGEVAYSPNNITAQQRTALTEQATDQILKFLSLNRTDIAAETILQIPHAYVIYDTWRQRNLPRLLTGLADHEIHSIGRYGAWKYASMQEAVLDGKQAAGELLQKINKKGNVYQPARVHQQRMIMAHKKGKQQSMPA
jgi:protoporphyrinogen oxidase